MTGATAVTATFGNLSQQLQSVERRLLGQRSLTVLQRLDVTSGRKQRGRQLKFQRGSRPVVGDDVGQRQRMPVECGQDGGQPIVMQRARCSKFESHVVVGIERGIAGERGRKL